MDAKRLTAYGSPERWAEAIAKQVAADGGMTELMSALYRAAVNPATDEDREALARVMDERVAAWMAGPEGQNERH